MADDRDSAVPSGEPTNAQRSPATRSLMLAIILDTMPPDQAVCRQFGIQSLEHFEAICLPVRHGEITAAQLEGAIGDGPKLTELVNAASRNPHKDILFTTSVATDGHDAFEQQLKHVAKRGRASSHKENDNGMEM